MAAIEFIHFCDHAFLDSRGHACLIGVRSAASMRAFPGTLAQLTVAIAVRLRAGETAHLRAEIGASDGKPQRAANFSVDGPPAEGPRAEGLTFMPFTNMTLFFDRPHVMRARVLDVDTGTVLAEKTLEIVLEPNPRQ